MESRTFQEAASSRGTRHSFLEGVKHYNGFRIQRIRWFQCAIRWFLYAL